MINPRVIELLNALPLGAVDDVRARFPGVIVDIKEEADDLGTLRILTTSSCRMRCQFPGRGGELWCHDEGMIRNDIPPAELDRMLSVVRYFRGNYGIKRVSLAGLQPILNAELCDFVSSLRDCGIGEVSLTSHGLRLMQWLPRLACSGLTSLVLSVQGFSRAGYRAIMGLDSFDNAMEVVDLARDLKIPVAVNRVLLRGYEGDIPGVLEWIKARDLRVRLYDLMWKPGQDQHFLDFHISWQSLIQLWEQEIDHIDVWTYRRPGRLNLVFWLKGGGSIETNISIPMEMHDAPICQTCDVKDACTEGYLGCGLRVTPDYRAQPCLWRSDLAVPLLPLVESQQGDTMRAAMDRVFSGSTDT